MRIAFYLDNQSHKGVDYSNPEKGNPGIGGTQFLIWSTAYYYSIIYPDVEVVLIAPIVDNLPKTLTKVQADNLLQAINKASDYNCDILIIRDPHPNKEYFELIEKKKLNCIMWCHNFINYPIAELAYQCKFIKYVVCVGKEQQDTLIDHPVHGKSICLYNGIDFSLYNMNCESEEKENIVCYMGALIKDKGFHILAKEWKKILKKVPDAKLIVVGGGDLYWKNSKAGEYNICEAKYENKFIRYLINDNGDLLDSVKFMGTMGGKDKIEILTKAKVGIANPTGKTETFCIVATEFQAVGTPVVTIAKNGFLDTIKDKETGLLYNNKNEFHEYIVELLKNNEKNNKLGANGMMFVRQNFDIYKVCEEWNRLFLNIVNNEFIYNETEYVNLKNNKKWLRVANKKIKKIKILKKMPSIMWYEYVPRAILKKLK